MVLTCEQALCLEKKVARKGKGKGEGEGERPFWFSLSPVPRLAKGLFTGYNGVGIHLFS